MRFNWWKSKNVFKRRRSYKLSWVTSIVRQVPVRCTWLGRCRSPDYGRCRSPGEVVKAPYNICQRTKISRHRFYDELISLSQFFALWEKISMNFVTGFSFSKYQNKIYDSCLVIMNRYIKMTLYISVTKNINALKLTEIIDKKVNLQFDSSKKIVSNRDFVFTNSY